MSMMQKIKKFLSKPYKCDSCGPCGWSKALIGFDVWRMKDGSIKYLCRDCSGYRSFFL